MFLKMLCVNIELDPSTELSMDDITAAQIAANPARTNTQANTYHFGCLLLHGKYLGC